MKKLIFLFAILLVGCSKVPQEKYNIAKHCVDSLREAGAMNTSGFYFLPDMMKEADSIIKRQEAMLFKKYDVASNILDDVIVNSRRFVITNDIVNVRKNAIRDINYVNTNSIKLEVEIEFDANQTKESKLQTANVVDETIRRNLINAKLIRVKILE
jgi:hypothetical protein